MSAKMEEKHLKSLLDGSASDIPDISSKIVRVFISSTFSDMIWERNALMERVYPKLKDYCRDFYGLEFQAVDMRWGVHADAQNDHQASSLCLQEIRNCQRLSVGPNFVILMGQKYGSRPFPSSIKQSEFETLLSALDESDGNLELLNTWFKIDTNSIPPKFLLQPITTILKHYNDKDASLRVADQKKWSEIYMTLMKTLRSAASVCHKQGKIDTETMENYFISVTENEIVTGVLQYREQAAKKCICFVREIDDLKDNLQHLKTSKYIDLKSNGQLDEEAGELLKTLKDQKLPAVLPEDSMCRYTVSWAENGGINPNEHTEYLDKFCDDFYSKLVNLIDQSMSELTGLQDSPLFTEVVQHLKMANAWTSVFHGREDVLSSVQEYICSDSKRPLIIHGASGSGKSAVMARSLQLSTTWMGKREPVVIIRFLGITPKSSAIHPVLDSICNQLCVLFGKDPSTIPSDYAQLMSYFRELLQVATPKRPILIFLDSLDQLSAANFSFKLTWLPKILPANVKLILSTLPDLFGILENLGKFLASDNFIELEPLGNELSQETLIDRLRLANRTLGDQQMAVLDDVFKVCSLPLFIKVMFEEICVWKSYSQISSGSISSSIEGAINTMFENLEAEHGKVLVSHALAFLTASKNGLTLVELEDLLSLDDEVLSSVFTYWLPPIRRIPPAIVTRLRLQMTGYVVDREADNVAVIYWYHRKFIEVARSRYLSNKDFAKQIHSILSDYFIGSWGGGNEKPFTYSDFLASRLNIKEKTGSADRKVPLQPLQFHHGSNGKPAFNMRKLRELPQQLVAAGRLEDLKSLIAFNYDWYIAKIKAFSLQDLLADLSLARTVLPEEKSVKDVMDVLRLGASALHTNPDCLSLELSGRLLEMYDSDPNITHLIEDCDKSTECMLTVPFQCFDGPTKSLLLSLEGHNKAIIDAIFLNGKELVSFGWDGMLCFWDLSSGELLKQVDASFIDPNLRAFLLLSSNKKYLVALNKVEASFIGIYLAETGDLLHKYKHSYSQHLHRIVIGENYLCVDFAIVDLKSGKVVNRLNKYNVKMTEYVLVAFANQEEHILISGSTETTLYDIATCTKLFAITGDQTPSQIRVTQDGRFAFIGYAVSCLIKMVDVDKNSPQFGKELLVIDIPKLLPDAGIAEDTHDLFAQEVSYIVMSADGTFVLAVLKYLYIAVWKLDDQQVKPKMLEIPDLPEYSIRSHRYNYSPTFTPDNKLIVAYKLDGTFLVWNVDTGMFVAEIIAHSNEIMHLSIESTCNLMATVSKGDLTVKVWDVGSFHTHPKQNRSKMKESYTRFLLIPYDHDVAISVHTVAKYSRKCYQMMDHFGLDLWNLATRSKKCILPFGRFGQLCGAYCSNNGEVLLLALGTIAQRRIRVINLKNSVLLFSSTQPYCVKTRLSGDGKIFTTVTNEEGKFLSTLRHSEGGFLIELFENHVDVALLSDSSMAVLISNVGELTTYHFNTGDKNKMALNFPSDKVISIPGLTHTVLVLSKPNKKKQRQVKVIDVDTLKELGSLVCVSESGIQSFTSDGKYCIDSDLQVFDLGSVKKIKQLQQGTRAVAGQIKLLGMGEYAVWVDAIVTDLLKVCRVSDDKIVACCSLHATPETLEVSASSNSIVVGTNLGHVLVFGIKTFADNTDLPDGSSNKQIVRRSTEQKLECFDLPEVSLTLQEELKDLAKQARMFAFNTTTLEPTTTESTPPSSGTCTIT